MATTRTPARLLSEYRLTARYTAVWLLLLMIEVLIRGG